MVSRQSDITTLSTLRHQAYIALNSQDTIEENTVVAYKNVLTFEAPLSLDNKKLVSQAVILFKNNRIGELSKIIQTELASIFAHQSNPTEFSKQFVFELTFAIIAESISLGVNIDVISKQSEIYSKIFSSDDIESLEKYALDFAENVSQELTEKRLNSKNALITMAKNYLEENLKNSKLKP